jgi:hypothetical protein
MLKTIQYTISLAMCLSLPAVSLAGGILTEGDEGVVADDGSCPTGSPHSGNGGDHGYGSRADGYYGEYYDTYYTYYESYVAQDGDEYDEDDAATAAAALLWLSVMMGDEITAGAYEPSTQGVEAELTRAYGHAGQGTQAGGCAAADPSSSLSLLALAALLLIRQTLRRT